MVLFADAAYALSPWIMAPFKGNLGPRERRFKKTFSKVRIDIDPPHGNFYSLCQFARIAGTFFSTDERIRKTIKAHDSSKEGFKCEDSGPKKLLEFFP